MTCQICVMGFNGHTTLARVLLDMAFIEVNFKCKFPCTLCLEKGDSCSYFETPLGCMALALHVENESTTAIITF